MRIASIVTWTVLHGSRRPYMLADSPPANFLAFGLVVIDSRTNNEHHLTGSG